MFLYFTSVIESITIEKQSKLVSGGPLSKGSVVDKLLSGTAPLYEWIQMNEYIKPYFDIDYLCADDDSFEELCKSTLNESIDALKYVFPQLTDDDLRISSYNGVEKSMHYGKPVKKYGKNLISYHIVIKNYRTTKTQNKKMAEVLKQVYEHFDTSVYKGNQLFRVGGHHKHIKRDTGCRKPEVLYYQNDAFHPVKQATKNVGDQTKLENHYDHLINLIDEDAPLLTSEMVTDVPSVPSVPDTTSTTVSDTTSTTTGEIDSELYDLLKQLPLADVNEVGRWWYITKCIKSIGDTTVNRNTWNEWSKQSTHYDCSDNVRQWQNTKDLFNDGLARIKKRVLQHGDILNDIHIAFQRGTDRAMVELFIQLFKNYFRVVDYKKNDIWMFDQKTNLWKEVCRDYFHSFLSQHFTPYAQQYMNDLNTSPDKYFPLVNPDDEEEIKKRKKTIKSHLGNVLSTENTKVKNNYKVEFFTHEAIQDSEFYKRLNVNEDLLSVNNGVVDLTTGELRQRKYDDYISKALELDYDPTIKPESNTAFTQFIHEIFDAEGLDAESIVQFMKAWFGYSITGRNTAQKCVILYGKGSNGKSLLNDILITVLRCKCGKMVDTWNSNLFDDVSAKKESSNQATPERAKLVDCCIGIINESSEGLLFGEMFKKLVDNTHSLTYRALHQMPKELKLITKFLMSTNYFPNFPVEDAFVRRIQTVPMLVKFTENPSGANEKMRDTKMFDKMTDTVELKQAILNWMIEGAKEYYARDRDILPLPLCCEKYKMQYIAKNDWVNFFEITDNKKDVLPFDEIYNEINTRMSRRDLTQKSITEKLKEAGAEQGRKTIQGRKVKVFKGIKMREVYEDLDETPFMFSNGMDNSTNC